MKETVRVFYPADQPEIEINHVRHGATLWTVLHTDFTLCSVLDSGNGHCVYTCRGRTHEARTGQVSLMQPGDVHSTKKITHPADFQVIHIPASQMARVAQEMGCPGAVPAFNLHVTDRPELFYALGRLHQSLGDPGEALESQSRLVETLGCLIDGFSERHPPPLPGPMEKGAVRRTVEYLRENWSQNVTLEALSAASGLSRFHLLRSFSKAMGIPPHAYQIQLRVAKVKEFVRSGMGIAEASAEAGFYDQAHCHRHFKRITHVSPATYRKTLS